jgi:hypothetical protein
VNKRIQERFLAFFTHQVADIIRKTFEEHPHG